MVDEQKKYMRFALFRSALIVGLNVLLTYRHRQQKGAEIYSVFLISCLILSVLVLRGDMKRIRRNEDSIAIGLSILFIWGLLVMEFKLGHPLLYPSPIRIMELLVEEFPRFIDNFLYSMGLLCTAFVLALATAFPLGLYLGINGNARAALDPYIKTLSLISPIAYVPYVVGIMPTFRMASLVVVYTGLFWPILKWSIYGYVNLDPDFLLTSRLLGLNARQHYFKVIIPGMMPAVMTGISGGITGGFTVLISAEIIGSRFGLGFFIKYFADFMNYHKVVTGIIYLGLAAIVVSALYEKLQSTVLSWQVDEKKKKIWGK